MLLRRCEDVGEIDRTPKGTVLPGGSAAPPFHRGLVLPPMEMNVACSNIGDHNGK